MVLSVTWGYGEEPVEVGLPEGGGEWKGRREGLRQVLGLIRILTADQISLNTGPVAGN